MIPMAEEPDVRSQRAVALLSNGSYHVMITSACGGYSTWRDLDVTRWREDTTRDSGGQLCYVRDLGEESAWTIGRQPLSESDESAFEFHADRAEFREKHGDLEVQVACLCRT
jgi:cellobiose phosphorylase